jgi:hypothetical protein
MKTLTEQEIAQVAAAGVDGNMLNGVFEALVLLGFAGGIAVCGLAFAAYTGYHYYNAPATH